MPTYTFRCQACSKDFEKVLRIKQLDEPVLCEDCGGKCIKTITTAPGFRFDDAKPTGGFRDVIKKIKEKEPHNNLPDY